MTVISVSNRTRVYEIMGVLLTALGKFIFMDFLNLKLPFIVISIIAWTSYVMYRRKGSPGILCYGGFRTDNFMKVVRMVMPFVVLSIAAFIGIGVYQKTINYSWHIIPILILYPIWGTIQQFLLIALMAGNLNDYTGSGVSRGIIIFLSAVLFGSIHYPYTWLIIGTFVLALFYGWIYLKQRNLYVLGIVHGWLGALFYYTVVDRDPFVEAFGRYLQS